MPKIGSPATDRELLWRVRLGDERAYGALYERHSPIALRLARTLVRRPHDADDAMSEAFASILGAIRRGHGPDDAFAPYLLTCVRHECDRSQRRGDAGRQIPVDPAAELDHAHDRSDPFARVVDDDAIVAAFSSLSVRHRTVLWQTEVEGRSHADIGRSEGLNAAAVATLALRARRALATAYLEIHLGSSAGLPSACQDIRRHLADRVRGTATARRTARVDAHTASCERCASARADLEQVNRSLAEVSLETVLASRVIPPPAVLGILAHLQAWLSGIATPLAAVAALTVAVVDGPLTPPIESDAPTPTAAAREVDAGGEPARPLVPAAAADPAPAVVATPPVVRTSPAPTAGAAPQRDQPAIGRPRRGSESPLDRAARRQTSSNTSGGGPGVAPTADAPPIGPAPAVLGGPAGAPPPAGGGDPAAPGGVVPPPVAGAPIVPGETVGEVTKTVDQVVDAVGDVVEPVTDAVGNVTEPVVDAVDDVVGGVTDPVDEAVEGVTDPVEDIIDPVEDAVDPVVDELPVPVPVPTLPAVPPVDPLG